MMAKEHLNPDERVKKWYGERNSKMAARGRKQKASLL
jgi:hypothetical protein